MRNKVSSDWLPSYIKATRPVLEIFKMAGYFPDSTHTSSVQQANNTLIVQHQLDANVFKFITYGSYTF